MSDTHNIPSAYARFRWRLTIEAQRIYCKTCERNGRFVFHWHRGHQVGKPR